MKKGIWLAGIMALLMSCSRDKDQPDAYGTFEATEVTVSSMGTGKILWLKIEEGEVVDSGALVGVVDTMDLHLRKAQAREQQVATAARKADLESQIAVQEQNRANVMVDKDRVQRLLKGGAATQKQMDDINASLNVIEKQISSIRAQYVVLDAQVTTFDRQVAQLNNSISDSRIINPFNGTILTKYAEPDEVATYGKPLYTMADLTYLDLRVYVEGTQLPYIKLGQTVEVRYDKDKKSDFKTTGTVTWISETAEFTPKTIQTKEERVNLVYAVKVRVKNDGALKIGMPGEIKFMPEK